MEKDIASSQCALLQEIKSVPVVVLEKTGQKI